MQCWVVDDRRERDLDGPNLNLISCEAFHFVVYRQVIVDPTVRERMFVAPKHVSILFCACVCADRCFACTKSMIGCVSGLELPGYVQVGFSRSVCSK